VETEAGRLRPSGAEAVPLLRSQGRVLAEEVKADRDLPPFARARGTGTPCAPPTWRSCRRS
jgi:molybdopterin biosynthesis enzyme